MPFVVALDLDLDLATSEWRLTPVPDLKQGSAFCMSWEDGGVVSSGGCHYAHSCGPSKLRTLMWPF